MCIQNVVIIVINHNFYENASKENALSAVLSFIALNIKIMNFRLKYWAKAKGEHDLEKNSIHKVYWHIIPAPIMSNLMIIFNLFLQNLGDVMNNLDFSKTDKYGL